MGNQLYLWLFNNVNKYKFSGEEANQVKNEILSANVTEENFENPEVVEKMSIAYEKFLNLFYNNICGYRNGFANKPITSEELDCYLITTNAGIVPIGFYKSFYPDDAVNKVGEYYETCKGDIIAGKDDVIRVWEEKLGEINEKLSGRKIKKAGPGKLVFGIISMLALIAMSIISFIKLNVIGVFASGFDSWEIEDALESIPLISGGGVLMWIIYFVFTLLMMTIAVVDFVKIIKHICIMAKSGGTDFVVSELGNYIEQYEQRILNDISDCEKIILNAVTNGENIKVTQNTNVAFVHAVNKKMNSAASFAGGKRKKGIGVFIIIISLLFSLVSLFSILPFAEAIGTSIFANDYVIEDDDEDGDKKKKRDDDEDETQAPEEDEKDDKKKKGKNKKKEIKKYKISNYKLVREDVSWSEACREARRDGGYLVSINSEEEFDVINQIASEQDGFIAYWAGSSIAYDEYWDDAVWEDGTLVTYTNWYPVTEEPSYYSEEDGIEDCLMVFKVEDIWYYNDAADKVAYSGGIGYFIEYEEIVEEDELEDYYYDYAEEIKEDEDAEDYEY